VTSRFGTETSRASVDFTLLDPEGQAVHHEAGASETEVAVTARGGRGPWRACFKISRGPVLRPSVMVKVSYFTVNHMSLVGTKFEWQRGGGGQAGGAAAQLDPQLLGTRLARDEAQRSAAGSGSWVRPPEPDCESTPAHPSTPAGTSEQVAELSRGLQRLDYYLQNVTNEQRFLYSRAVRHLRTVESTHARAFWYYFLIYSVIMMASTAQVRPLLVLPPQSTSGRYPRHRCARCWYRIARSGSTD
jgi:hypothetical protein